MTVGNQWGVNFHANMMIPCKMGENYGEILRWTKRDCSEEVQGSSKNFTPKATRYA